MKIINYVRKNKAVFIAFLTLAWPTVLEELLSTVIQYIDTAMVGRLGPTATATVSLSSTYNWLINSIIYAFGIGFLSYIARAIGAKDEKKVHAAAGQALLVAVVLGVLLTGITMAMAPKMPLWMGAEPAIRRNASIYFMLINAPLLFRSAIIIFGSVIRSTGDTRTPMMVNILVNVINTGLNYVFIYLLAFGAIGAGIATLISYIVGGVLMTIMFCRNQTLGVRIQNMRLEKAVLWGCLSVGIPVMFTQIVSCSGYVVATSFVSSMATTVYAAHSIAITAETIFYIPGYGMQTAAATLAGNAYGAGDKEKMKELIGKRSASQPLDLPSAGSAFKRPEGGYAAALIDQAGLKGYQVGNAAISTKHAGFAVNLGGATAWDVKELLRQVSEKVYENSGIRLEPEIRIW